MERFFMSKGRLGKTTVTKNNSNKSDNGEVLVKKMSLSLFCCCLKQVDAAHASPDPLAGPPAVSIPEKSIGRSHAMLERQLEASHAELRKAEAELQVLRQVRIFDQFRFNGYEKRKILTRNSQRYSMKLIRCKSTMNAEFTNLQQLGP